MCSTGVNIKRICNLLCYQNVLSHRIHISLLSLFQSPPYCRVAQTLSALNGHTEVIQTLVQAKCDPNLQRRDGWTPLHLASWNGHYEAAQKLIESKCKINARTEEGMGVLHLVAAKGYDDIAQLALDHGVAPDMQDKVNCCFLVHCTTRYNNDVA